MLQSKIALATKEVQWAEERLNKASGSQKGTAINELLEAEERLVNLIKKKELKER